MNDKLTPIVGLLEITTNLYVKALSGVDRAVFVTRPEGKTNSLAWIAGHVLQSRARLRRLAGEDAEIPWPEVFSPGGALADPSIFPDAEQVVARWKEVTEALFRRLGTLDDGVLARPPQMRVPSHDGTLLGALAFAAYHEGYHTGQMGYLRRWHGLSPLIER